MGLIFRFNYLSIIDERVRTMDEMDQDLAHLLWLVSRLLEVLRGIDEVEELGRGLGPDSVFKSLHPEDEI